MKKVVIGLALAGLAYLVAMRAGPFADTSTPAPPAASSEQRAAPPGAASEDALARAFAQRQSNVQVESSGVVEKVLQDDNDGSRHQRLIVRLASGQTVLIAHNIDLAPRVEQVRDGEPIAFAGEYEWNNKGGVVHWTHRDPAGRHRAGWIHYDGRTYQ